MAEFERKEQVSQRVAESRPEAAEAEMCSVQEAADQSTVSSAFAASVASSGLMSSLLPAQQLQAMLGLQESVGNEAVQSLTSDLPVSEAASGETCELSTEPTPDPYTQLVQHRREDGDSRSPWAAMAGQSELCREPAAPSIDHERVNRTVETVLDGLEGWTSDSDSETISDALTGLPAPEQAAVLKKIMGRYDERTWISWIGRFGEAWDGGMLYWLFEDLSEDDRARVANSLKASGVLAPEAIDALVAGRAWGGKYLPFTTRKGQEGVEHWADVAVRSSGAKRVAATGMKWVSGLWTPETAGGTVLALATARVGGVLATAYPTLGKGMLVAGTGVTSYTTTIAISELVTGQDAYTGAPLEYEDKVARTLQAALGILLLGVTALQVRAMSPGGGGPVLRDAPEVSGPVGSGRPAQFKVLQSDPATGEYTALAQHAESGELVHLRINVKTGNGIATRVATGDAVNLSEWQIQSRPAGLLPAGASTGGELSAQPTTALTRATPAGTPPGPLAVAAQAPAVGPALSAQVWVNTRTDVYHQPGSRWYGNTAEGQLMTVADAQAAGYRPADGGSLPPSGVLSVERSSAGGVVIRSVVGDPTRRADLERQFPTGREYGLEDYELAHSQGAGLRAESEAAIRLAPRAVNQELQRLGVERYIADLQAIKPPDVDLHLMTETFTHPKTLRLKEITYRLELVGPGGARRLMFEASIEVGSDRTNPTVSASVEYLAPELQ